MRTRRKPLVAGGRPQTPAEARDALSALEARRSPAPSRPTRTEESTTTAIHLPRETLHLLRRVAAERANRGGGRPSVSAVLVALVEEQRAKLEGELAR